MVGRHSANGGSGSEGDADVARMLAFREGDAAAFEALFERWFPPLQRYLDGLVRDAGRAEELAQEVFLRVHGARERYEPRARFSTWLYRIATNLARNELRRPERRVGAVAGAARDVVDERPGVDDVVDARRRSRTVTRALDGLTPPQREALWLAQVEGLPHAEIAEVLDTSVASVKMLVRRARLALADALRDAESAKGGGRGE